jgi:hypothetical protein
VISAGSPPQGDADAFPDRAMSIARRLANDLSTYFKMDADIVSDSEPLDLDGPAWGFDGQSPQNVGNVIVIGRPTGRYILWHLQNRRHVFSVTVPDKDDDLPVLQFRGKALSGSSQGNI